MSTSFVLVYERYVVVVVVSEERGGGEAGGGGHGAGAGLFRVVQR